MKRYLPLFLALLLVLPAACGGSGDTVEPDFQYLTDMLSDQPNLPEIPNHVFDLVEETDDPGPEVVILPDGKIQEVKPDPDVTDVEEPEETNEDDGACKPNCTLDDGSPKECGPDGCGSICGYCDYEHICVDGVCKEYCEPQCAGKLCGPDGCYGECPPGCGNDEQCGEDGLCYPFCDHDANCAGKQCGPDGCGGNCGSCGIGTQCNEETGLCEEDPCGLIDKEKGKCAEGNILVQCIDGQLVETNCGELGEDMYCKWDAPQQKYLCAEGCVPNCEFPDGTPKECGYDGCYGECGTCSSGWLCEAGACYPVAGAECGWITPAGHCIDNVLWFCNNGLLYIDDCAANGMNCQFDVGQGKFKCK